MDKIGERRWEPLQLYDEVIEAAFVDRFLIRVSVFRARNSRSARMGPMKSARTGSTSAGKVASGGRGEIVQSRSMFSL